MRFKCRMEIDYAGFFPWYIFWCTIFLFHRSTCHSISVAGLSFVHLRPDPLHTKTHFPTHRVKNHQRGSIKTDSIKDISQTKPYEKSKKINLFDFVFLSFTIFSGARWLVQLVHIHFFLQWWYENWWVSMDTNGKNTLKETAVFVHSTFYKV